MRVNALLYIILQGIFLGTTLTISRFGITQFNPAIYVGFRVFLASLFYLLIYLLFNNKMPWPKSLHLWFHASMFGIFGTALPMTAIVVSLQYLSSGVAAILLTLNPAFTVIWLHFTLKDEPLTFRKIVGITISLGGALMIVIKGETGLNDIENVRYYGYLLLFIAVASSSGMTVYARKFLKGYESVHVSSIRMFSTTLAVLPISVIIVGIDLSTVNHQGYLSLIYAAIGTIIAMFLAFYNIKHFGATAAATAQYLVPVVGCIGGVLLLGEHITINMIIGIIIIAIGIGISNQKILSSWL